jgi:hypothetical protein
VANFNTIFLSETRLNAQCYNYNFFPCRYTVYRSHREYTNKAPGGGISKAIATSLGSCNHRYDLELCSECVWVEVPTADGISILTGNHYFAPDTKPDVITVYFHHLENALYWEISRLLVLTGRWTPLPKGQYYSKLKWNATYTSTSSWTKALRLLIVLACLT